MLLNLLCQFVPWAFISLKRKANVFIIYHSLPCLLYCSYLPFCDIKLLMGYNCAIWKFLFVYTIVMYEFYQYVSNIFKHLLSFYAKAMAILIFWSMADSARNPKFHFWSEKLLCNTSYGLQVPNDNMKWNRTLSFQF